MAKGKKWTVAAIREAAVVEYLKGGINRRALAKKYGVTTGAVNRWVTSYFKLQKRCYPDKELPKKYWRPKAEPKPTESQEVLPKEVKQLRDELRKARLHNQLLQAMIEIAEKDFGVDIRKKSGTKRS